MLGLKLGKTFLAGGALVGGSAFLASSQRESALPQVLQRRRAGGVFAAAGAAAPGATGPFGNPAVRRRARRGRRGGAGEGLVRTAHPL